MEKKRIILLLFISIYIISIVSANDNFRSCSVFGSHHVEKFNNSRYRLDIRKNNSTSCTTVKLTIFKTKRPLAFVDGSYNVKIKITTKARTAKRSEFKTYIYLKPTESRNKRASIKLQSNYIHSRKYNAYTMTVNKRPFLLPHVDANGLFVVQQIGLELHYGVGMKFSLVGLKQGTLELELEPGFNNAHLIVSPDITNKGVGACAANNHPFDFLEKSRCPRRGYHQFRKISRRNGRVDCSKLSIKCRTLCEQRKARRLWGKCQSASDDFANIIEGSCQQRYDLTTDEQCAVISHAIAKCHLAAKRKNMGVEQYTKDWLDYARCFVTINTDRVTGRNPFVCNEPKPKNESIYRRYAFIGIKKAFACYYKDSLGLKVALGTACYCKEGFYINRNKCKPKDTCNKCQALILPSDQDKTCRERKAKQGYCKVNFPETHPLLNAAKCNEMHTCDKKTDRDGSTYYVTVYRPITCAGQCRHKRKSRKDSLTNICQKTILFRCTCHNQRNSRGCPLIENGHQIEKCVGKGEPTTTTIRTTTPEIRTTTTEIRTTKRTPTRATTFAPTNKTEEGTPEMRYCRAHRDDAKCGRNAKKRTHDMYFAGYFCYCDLDNGYEGDGYKCWKLCPNRNKANNKKCPDPGAQCVVYDDGKQGCECMIGVRRDPQSHKCSIDIDECKECRTGCKINSKCYNRNKMTDVNDDAYTCKCDPGYKGRGKETCKDINECNEEWHDCDKPRATCKNTEPGYKCVCGEGWRGDPNAGTKTKPCQDEDECKNGNHKCDNVSTTCVNTEGCYQCKCNSGFEPSPDDNYKCTDRDECANRNLQREPRTCHFHARCENIPGSYKCICKEGYVGNGYKCKPDPKQCDKCDKESTTCKLNAAKDKYICECRGGYQAGNSPYRCDDLDECMFDTLNHCDKRPGHATCINTPGSYKCKCHHGYETKDDARTCTAKNPCLRINCTHLIGSRCVANGREAECFCPNSTVKNKQGTRCLAINDYPVNNCSTCEKKTQICERLQEKGYEMYKSCFCKPGYQSNPARSSCDNENECTKPGLTDCDPNANCIDKIPHLHDGKRYECVCKKGFTGDGKVCRDDNECTKPGEKACKGARKKCKNTIGSFECTCKRGYYMAKGMTICVDVDECTNGMANCPPFSKCKNTDGSYKCICIKGYRMDPGTKNATKKCLDINECTEQKPCNSSTSECVNMKGTYNCKCKKGFQKIGNSKNCYNKNECELNIHDCNAQTQECTDTFGSFKCKCKEGLRQISPKKCENIDECKEKTHKCAKNSHCIDEFMGYKCKCNEFFEPMPGANPIRPNCQVVNPCEKKPQICGYFGKCIPVANKQGYKCECRAPALQFDQQTCVVETYCDKEYHCPSNSSCIEASCQCKAHHSWTEIEKPLTKEKLRNRKGCPPANPCQDPHICDRPQMCKYTGPEKFKCVCPHGFKKTQDGKECTNKNECAEDVPPPTCPENSKCQDTSGAFRCACNKGFRDKHRGSNSTNPDCEDINECKEQRHDCPQTMDCWNTIGSFRCECKKGFKRDLKTNATTCINKNECKKAKQPCTENARCFDTEGSFYCECIKGFYQAQNGSCLDINECDPDYPEHNCTEETQICQNTPGSFKCICKKGYKDVGGKCVDVDECKEGLDNCGTKSKSGLKLKCENTIGSFRCSCPEGYVKNDDECQDVNECKLSSTQQTCPVGEGNTCKNTPGSFECGCEQGYMKPRQCSNKPKTCACKNINECKQWRTLPSLKGRHPCGKRAKCRDTAGSFECYCPKGFEPNPDPKVACKALDPCKTKECDKKTEKCVVFGEEAKCTCKRHHKKVKERCVLNPCTVRNPKPPCGDKATCIPRPSGDGLVAVCRCPTGFKLEGNQCKDIDECKCPNNGMECESKACSPTERRLCRNKNGGFICVCKRGFREVRQGNVVKCEDENECEKKTDECEKIAKCVNTIGSYKCLCPEGMIETLTHECIADKQCTKEGCTSYEFCDCSEKHRCKCKCKAGYKGDPCTKVDPCKNWKQRNLCNPRTQKCVEWKGKHKCECVTGFKWDGSKCIDIPECAEQPNLCGPNAECHETPGSYRCSCIKGYSKKNGSKICTDDNECLMRTANCNKKTERCINTKGGYRCECDYPRYRPSKDGCVDNDQCASGEFNCPMYGVCKDKEGGYLCGCRDGFEEYKDPKTGIVTKCLDVEDCTKVPPPCDPMAKCQNRIGSFECICQKGYYPAGNKCYREEPSCPQCHKSAHCMKSKDNTVYNCTCNPGFRGDGVKNCEQINECTNGEHKCVEHAKCKDRTPGYDCECQDPYVGDGKKKCDREMYCLTKKHDCPRESICKDLNQAGSDGRWYSCNCTHPGFRFNAKTRQCEDINECDKNPCPEKARCRNTEGSYMCECPDGYDYNKKENQCNDYDECENEGIEACKPKGECKNTPGDFECTCPEGYEQTKDKKGCKDIDECKRGIDKCNKNSTICINVPEGSYSCKCKDLNHFVHTTDKLSCADIKECLLPGSCGYQQTCTELIGGYKCECDNLHYLTITQGRYKRCKPKDDCKRTGKTCGENAFCATVNGTEKCFCEQGFKGNPDKRCDDIKQCIEGSVVCPHESRCVEIPGSYRCVCKPGFRMIQGQCQNKDECIENQPCKNNAQCVDKTPEYECVCPLGTNGASESGCKKDECALNKNLCHKNAICNDTETGYFCRCKKGYKGNGQECFDMKECSWKPPPCSLYAECTEMPGSYKCTCKPGYTGDGFKCTDIDECKTKKCNKHATCVNTQGSYQCICDRGFTQTEYGPNAHCEDLDECKGEKNTQNPCDPSQSRCVNTEGSVECECKEGYEKSEDKDDPYSCFDRNECEEDKEKCGIHECQNEVGDYKCKCRKGFTPKDKHTCRNDNECLLGTHKCDPNAICQDREPTKDSLDMQYLCTCKKGFRGDGLTCTPENRCLKDEDNNCDKKSTKCKNIPNTGEFQCPCIDGFERMTSRKCQNENECKKGTDTCDDETEICVDQTPSSENKYQKFICKCKPGYKRTSEKESCVNINECSEYDAQYEKTKALLIKIDDYKISKKLSTRYNQSLFEGQNKSSPYEQCRNRDNRNFRREKFKCSDCYFCVDTPGSWECGCPIPMKKVPHRSTRWKCKEPPPCENPPGTPEKEKKCAKIKGGFCKPGLHDYTCGCPNPYHKAPIKHQFYTHECKKDECMNDNECKGNFRCRPQSDGGLVCKPRPGWKRIQLPNGNYKAEDIDECKEMENICGTPPFGQKCQAECINTMGSYKCSCPNGIATGKNCQCRPTCHEHCEWYQDCLMGKCQCKTVDSLVQMDNATAEDKTRKVCSRVLDCSIEEEDRLITFNSKYHLINYLCKGNKLQSRVSCYTPPSIKDSSAAYNYDGSCFTDPTKIKCPDGAKPLDFDVPLCPFAKSTKLLNTNLGLFSDDCIQAQDMLDQC